MPSKKRKYNARFPAGRIKKIMQTDEEVGKVAQAVPIIISRTLELFVESLLSKAMQVTLSRNAKTLSPSHVKQCILAESRFDFLKDLVKNIPDVSAAEEKELMSAESSPNSSRYSEISAAPRRIAREDSNSSSSSDLRPQRDGASRGPSSETVTSATLAEVAIDLTTRPDERPVRIANFYQETLLSDDSQHQSVITPNPTYATLPPPTPQPSTSTFARLAPVEPPKKLVIPVPKPERKFHAVSASPLPTPPATAPVTPVNPLLNIDFSKNLGIPEIKVLDSAVTGVVGVAKNARVQRQNSKAKEPKRAESKPVVIPVDIDHLNSGNLQIDEDYDT